MRVCIKHSRSPSNRVSDNVAVMASAFIKGYAYDAWNRETQMLRTITSGVIYDVDSNIDALGRRMQVVATSTTSGTPPSLPTDNLYYSVSGQVLEDDNSVTTNGGPNTGYNQMQFVWSPTYINDLVLRDRATAGDGNFNERLYVQHDANHNVTAITNTSGSVLQRWIYDPYGVAACLTSNWAGTTDAYNFNYLFQGGRYDPTSGLYSFDAREYDPSLGRWMQQEPFGALYFDGANLYQFVDGNPIGWVDPWGLSPSAAASAEAEGLGVGYTVAKTIDDINLALKLLDYDRARRKTQELRDMLQNFGVEEGRAKAWAKKRQDAIDDLVKAQEAKDKPAAENAPAKCDQPAPTAKPSIPHPGNLPPGQSPGPDFEWRGQPPEGGGQGNWYNKATGESLWNDMNSKQHDPHWDYRLKSQSGKWRWYEDGRLEYQK